MVVSPSASVIVVRRRQQPFKFSSRAVNHKTEYYINATMSISLTLMFLVRGVVLVGGNQQSAAEARACFADCAAEGVFGGTRRSRRGLRDLQALMNPATMCNAIFSATYSTCPLKPPLEPFLLRNQHFRAPLNIQRT